MEHVWKTIEELRERYETLREDRTPIDVFAFIAVQNKWNLDKRC